MNSYVFIIGATGGLGKDFALECAERGWDLFLTDRDSSNLQELSRGIKWLYNIHILYKSCDLTDDKVQILCPCISDYKCFEFSSLLPNACKGNICCIEEVYT